MARLVFKSLVIETTKPKTFIKELDKLLDKFANNDKAVAYAYGVEE